LDYRLNKAHDRRVGRGGGEREREIGEDSGMNYILWRTDIRIL
jgi:hypothetical protein